MTSTPAYGARSIKALLIEDSADDIVLIERLVAQSGLNVDLQVIRDGEAALDFLLLQEELPQVVLLDISLPRISGLEILHKIKSQSLLVDIPVIVVSATDQADQIREEASLAHTQITKPISIGEFAWIIRSVESYWRRVDRLNTLGDLYLLTNPSDRRL